MTVEDLVNELNSLLPDAEVLIDVNDKYMPICRVEDDSQGVYIVSDSYASDQEGRDEVPCM
jgi:hypothetical protein